MIGDISKFDKLENSDGAFVKLGNDVLCLVKSRGSLRINDKIICDDSYWVQWINYNLFIFSQLNNIGHKLEF